LHTENLNGTTGRWRHPGGAWPRRRQCRGCDGWLRRRQSTLRRWSQRRSGGHVAAIGTLTSRCGQRAAGCLQAGKVTVGCLMVWPGGGRRGDAIVANRQVWEGDGRHDALFEHRSLSACVVSGGLRWACGLGIIILPFVGQLEPTEEKLTFFRHQRPSWNLLYI
jgi:hypothetical protein